jgi:hypothetical protein
MLALLRKESCLRLDSSARDVSFDGDVLNDDISLAYSDENCDEFIQARDVMSTQKFA